MPTYEFICEKGHTSIEERKVEDRNKMSICSAPLCDAKLKRLYSTPTITFKGSGFYSTGG